MRESKNPAIKEVFSTVVDLNSKYTHKIKNAEASGEGSKTHPINCKSDEICLNIDYDNKNGDGVSFTMYECLGHELKHAYDNQLGIGSGGKVPGQTFDYDEISTTYFENLIRNEEGRPIRKKYGNVYINKTNKELYKKPLLWKDWKNRKL